jgi:hypothetical protein
MKKLLILAALAITFVSCKKETPQPTNNKCNCAEVTYLKWFYTQNTWEEQNRVNTQQMDCWRHGEVTSEWNTTQIGLPQEWKKQIVCE